MEMRELKRLVAKGEGQHLEFKRKAKFPEKIVREMVAFANSDGGILLIGVADNLEITGVQNPDEEEYLMEKAITSLIQPKLDFTLQRIDMPDEAAVLVYTIPIGEQKPYFVQYPDQPKAYIRLEDRSIQASRELREVLKHRAINRLTRVQLGAKEQVLFAYLREAGSITLNQFATLASISRKIASRTLVLLAANGLLTLLPGEEEDLYTLPAFE